MSENNIETHEPLLLILVLKLFSFLSPKRTFGTSARVEWGCALNAGCEAPISTFYLPENAKTTDELDAGEVGFEAVVEATYLGEDNFKYKAHDKRSTE